MRGTGVDRGHDEQPFTGQGQSQTLQPDHQGQAEVAVGVEQTDENVGVNVEHAEMVLFDRPPDVVDRAAFLAPLCGKG